MAKVVDLADYRAKKRKARETARSTALDEVREAYVRADKLVRGIIEFQLVKNYGIFRASHGFERAAMRMELTGLIRKYGFDCFSHWA